MKKGWHKRAPKTGRDRRALLARCGRDAFLEPGNLKFPVVAKTGGCAVDCAGAQAALVRARQFGHKAAAAKARTLLIACRAERRR